MPSGTGRRASSSTSNSSPEHAVPIGTGSVSSTGHAGTVVEGGQVEVQRRMPGDAVGGPETEVLDGPVDERGDVCRE